MFNLHSKFKKFYVSCFTLLLSLINLNNLCNAEDYYGNLSFGKGVILQDTYNIGLDPQYPYNFSSNFAKGSIGIGKHISKNIDLELEVSRFSDLKHNYKGVVQDPFPTLITQNITSKQKIHTSLILIGGKYKKTPEFFDKDSAFYVKLGLGIAFNKSGDFESKVGNTYTLIVPGYTKKNLAFNGGIGFHKTINKITYGFGYDLYSIGSFKTQDKQIIQNIVKKSIHTEENNEGKILKPNIIMHTLSVSIAFDF
jgi:hypothetical protein